MKKRLFVGLTVFLLSLGTASAQDHGSVGITMGYPSSLGIIWHVTDRFAILPEVSVSRNESEATFTTTTILTSLPPQTITTTSTSSTEGWSVSPGVNLRFYLSKSDNVSTYLTTGFDYMRGSVTNTGVFVGPSFSNLVGVVTTTTRTEVEKSTTEGFGIGGAIGVQYTPHRRFGIFGEVGVRYFESDNDHPGHSSTFKNSGLGNSSSVGVILYF